MRSGVNRATLRREVQAEAGLSTDPGHSAQIAEKINAKLNRAERQMALKHTWPKQTMEREVTITANSQYGALPAAPSMNFTMVNTVWTIFGGDWLPVAYGIGAEQRSLYDTTARVTPISRWEVLSPGAAAYVVGVAEYEVWPISAQNETLRFTGERGAGNMDSDDDTCVLDGDALVQQVAGELLAKSAPELAQVCFANADSIIRSILNRQVGRKEDDVNLAERPRGYVGRPWIDWIPPTS